MAINDSITSKLDAMRKAVMKKVLGKWTGKLTIILSFRDGGIGDAKIMNEENLKE